MGQDPLTMAAPILKGGPGALDIGYKRMGIEAEANRQALAAKAAAEALKQKERIANQKAENWTPPHVDLIHSNEWLTHQDYREKQDAELRMNYKTLPPTDPKNLGDPDDPKTQAGQLRRAWKVQDAQYVANSLELGDAMKKDIEYVRTRPGEFTNEDGSPTTENDILRAYGNTSIKGSERPNIMDNNFQIAPWLDKRASVLGTSSYENAVLNPDGTVTTTGNEGVDLSKILAEARAAAIDDFASPALGKQLTALAENDPAGFAEVRAIAKKQNLPLVGAMAFQQLFDRAGGRKHTESQTALSDAGAGRADRMASVKELLETGFGIIGGASSETDIQKVFPKLSIEETQKFMAKYPELAKQRFDLKGDDIITNYNNLYFDTEVGANGKKIPAKVRGIVRDKSNGSVRVVYSTDINGTDVTVTEPIPKKEFYSKVIRRIAINNPEYDINIVDNVADKEYNLINGSGGQIDLPKRGPKGGILDIPKTASPILNIPRK